MNKRVQNKLEWESAINAQEVLIFIFIFMTVLLSKAHRVNSGHRVAQVAQWSCLNPVSAVLSRTFADSWGFAGIVSFVRLSRCPGTV